MPIALFCLLGMLCLAAASSKAQNTTAKQVIEVPLLENGNGMTSFIRMARAYENLHPDVRIDISGDPRMADKLRVRILEGSLPEMINDLELFGLLSRRDELLALDEFLDGPNWEGDQRWRDTLLPGSLDPYTINGKVYAVPLSYFIYSFWYNKAFFEHHGLQPPTNWDQFFELSRKIHSLGVAPLAFQGRYPTYALMMVNSAYYQRVGSERYQQQIDLQPGSFDNAAMREALAVTQRVARECFQPGAMGMSHTEAQMQFCTGSAAMIPCGSWLKSEMAGKIPEGFRLGTFNLPSVAHPLGDPNAVLTASGKFYILKRSPNARLAVDFLRFMTSRQMAATLVQDRDTPVAVRGVNQQYLSGDMQELAQLLERAPTSYSRSPNAAYPDIEQAFTDVMSGLLTGRMTPEAGAQRLEREAASVRDRIANPEKIVVRHRFKPVILGVLVLLLIGWLIQRTQWRTQRARSKVVVDELRPSMRWKHVLVFLAFPTVLYLAFVILPAAASLIWSVQSWDGLTQRTWAGLYHFRRLLLESDGFWVALQNNAFVMVMLPLFVIPISLFLAAAISRRVHGSRLFRIVLFFPTLLSGVPATLIWMNIYNPGNGLANALLMKFGEAATAVGLTSLGATLSASSGIAWLSQENLYWSLIPMLVWGGCGFSMMLFLAAMESVPQELYEAAELDGASVSRQFWTITIPMIWESLCIAMIFMVIGGMKFFEPIWLLTNQMPTTDTHVIGTQMVQSMFSEFNIGQAAAIATLMFIMTMLLTLFAMRLLRREVVEM